MWVVGDLAEDTRVEQLDETRFGASPSRAWEIWGPMGGYMVALGLRAAGARAAFDHPASVSCQYLGVAAFEPVDIEVTTSRRARSAEAMRIQMTQAGRPILAALVWSVGDVEGLEHHEIEPPGVPGPDELVTEELAASTRYPFWDNIESRPVEYSRDWPPRGPLPPRWRTWARFRPRATFDDPWLDAARSAILVDVQGWPAASSHHAWRDPPYVAPSLDLYVAFHEPAPTEPWLLTDGYAPVAGDGLIGWTGRLWSTTGQLVASGAGQLLSRQVPRPT
jgi:acyl-CoA thioesterase-2